MTEEPLDAEKIGDRIGHVLAYRTNPRIVAAWESRGGTHWCYLVHAAYGYEYLSAGSGGSLPGVTCTEDDARTDEDAIARMESPCRWFPGRRYVDACQPDANTTPMRRAS